MIGTSETTHVTCLVHLVDNLDEGRGALNISVPAGTAALDPRTVLEETEPGWLTMTHPDLPATSSSMSFHAGSRATTTDGTGRQFEWLPLLRRLQQLPAGETLDIFPA